MTRQKTFKRRVRERMAKTGESYTAARRMLIAAGERPETAAAEFEPPVAEERVVEATGRGWQAWFKALDEWGAPTHTHTEMARWLREEHGVDGWYSQSITVGYERARGLRAPGERADGFAISATRTIARPGRAPVRGVRRRGAARAVAAGSGPARPHRDRAEVGPLRLGGRLDAGDRRVRRPRRGARAASRSPTSGCPTPRRPRR